MIYTHIFPWNENALILFNFSQILGCTTFQRIYVEICLIIIIAIMAR